MSYVPNATAAFSRETTYASKDRPYFVPAGGAPDITVNDLDVLGDLTVVGTSTLGDNVSVTGNISATGNITTVTGYMNQGDINIGTNYINVDNIGNPNIQIDAKEGGDGQAYFDLITQKLTTSTNLHRVRSIVGNTGAYTLYHQSGLPGPLTSLQSMNWAADGSNMTFALSGDTKLTVEGTGILAKAVATNSGQNPNIATNATTAIFTIAAASLPAGKVAHVPVGLYFFDGGVTQEYFVTYIINVARTGANISAYVENQTTADAQLLAATGQAWTLAVTGSGTPTLSVDITTLAAPVPVGGWYCNYNYTVIGGQ